MLFLGRYIRHMLAAVILIAVSGCVPPEPGQLEEEKELHFVRGNNNFNAMDYHGAIDEFRQALDVNPRSAQAHYRLAQLFDTKDPDPASAIFHYQEFLRLNPKAENPEIIQQRISACKQQLAADVLQMPSAPATLKKIEELSEANRLLQQQVDRLTETNRQWNAYFASEQAARKNNLLPPDQLIVNQSPDDTTIPVTKLPPPKSKPAPKPRTHLVATRETFASIARKYNVSVTALQAANPGVSAKKLRVGQSLNLPPP